ncbi:MAG: hypothetical protein DA408_05525 [Bacteroidetes bacterium]|nr:MAG: hypothetical protein C7N36_18515 [Bacteroidota bacterium]PTM13756.1 MAG: hypothetical protein DA408_05525 [Bacteroidota bacterium]
MKQLQFTLLLVVAFLVFTPSGQGAVLRPTHEKKTETLDQQHTKKERRQAVRQQRKSFRSALRDQLRAARESGSSADLGLLLLVIIALILPPLAMYLYDGETSSRFWISLVLLLLAIPLWGFLGALALTASIVYTLYIILSESL